MMHLNLTPMRFSGVLMRAHGLLDLESLIE